MGQRDVIICLFISDEEFGEEIKFLLTESRKDRQQQKN